MAKGLEFDPGFGPYILAFQGTVNYLYTDISRFKNLSQRKMKFKQYYKKFLEMFDNNLGFYIGCLMWAAYIKTQPEQEILNNPCLGGVYNEDENTAEPNFMLNFADLFPKDMKYFLGQDFEFDPSVKRIAEVYKDFLVINEGFVNSKNNTDIKLPEGFNKENAEGFKEIIDNAIKEGNLAKLLEQKELIK